MIFAGAGLRPTRTVCGVFAAAMLATLPAGPVAAQSLVEALSTAYSSNPTLQAARAELRTVTEQVPQALSNWRPRVTVNGSGGAQRIDSGSVRGEETTYPLSVDLTVSQSLYRGGQTVADTRRAEATVFAQRGVLSVVEQDILFSAADVTATTG